MLHAYSPMFPSTFTVSRLRSVVVLLTSVLLLVPNIPVRASSTTNPVFEDVSSSDLSVEDPQPPADRVPMSVSEMQYAALFQQAPLKRAPSRSGVSLQSVRVEWDEVDEFFPYLKLEVGMPVIPGFFTLVGPSEFHRFSQMVITNVKDKRGRNVYNAKSAFEEAPFTYFDFDYTDSSMERMAAQRTVHLKKGTKEKNLASVSGKVRFDLPVDIRPLEFKMTDINKTMRYASSTVTLKSVENGDVTFLYQGPTEHYIKMIGYDDQGHLLSWLEKTGTLPDARKQPIEIHTAFEGNPQTVSVFVAKKMLVKQLPFTLRAPKK